MHTNRLFRMLIEQLPLGVIVTDATGQVLLTSKVMRDMWDNCGINAPLQTCTDKSFMQIYHMDDTPYTYEEWPLARALRSNEVVKDESLKMKTKEGEWIYVNISTSPFCVSGKLEYAFIICENVTERTKQQEEIFSAKITSQFLATMSHEIRTPMHGIMGMLDMLKETSMTPEQTTYVDVTLRSAQNLLVILNDILDFSKMKAQKIDFTKKTYNIRQIFSDLDTMFSCVTRVTKNTPTELKVTVHEDVPTCNYGDSQRLMQCLHNIVSNAVKFVAEKKNMVVVQVSTCTTMDGNESLKITISDTGIGMTKDTLGKLFKPFTQADCSINRRFGGTGLGLAKVKEILDQMGGSINVESEVGKGSKFTLIVPMELKKMVEDEDDVEVSDGVEIAPVGMLKRRRSSTSDVKILLAEDNPVNKTFTVAQLRRYGYKVVAVEDGTEVLDAIEKNPDFDILLLDIQMPKMGGHQTCEILRSRSWNKPIIALTASAMDCDRERCMQVGMNDYMSKPFDIKRLVGKIDEWVKW